MKEKAKGGSGGRGGLADRAIGREQAYDEASSTGCFVPPADRERKGWKRRARRQTFGTS